MKDIKETHPSLCKVSSIDKDDYEYLIDSEHRDGGWIATRVGGYPSVVTIEGVQEHTIDKAVLMEAVAKINMQYGNTTTLRALLKELGLEEEENEIRGS